LDEATGLGFCGLGGEGEEEQEGEEDLEGACFHELRVWDGLEGAALLEDGACEEVEGESGEVGLDADVGGFLRGNGEEWEKEKEGWGRGGAGGAGGRDFLGW
jgi:hypothetical protein